MVGWFEPVAKPWGMIKPGGVGGIPESFCFDSLPEDFEHIAPLVEAATHRMPLLADTGIRLFFNGPEAFTPDDRYLLGESPDVRRAVHGVRVQLDRHPVVGRRGQGAGRLDHRRPPADGSVGRRRPPRHAVPAQRQLPARPHRRSARAAVRDALAVPATGNGTWRAPVGPARSSRRTRRLLRRGRRLGTAPTGSPRKVSSLCTSTATAGRTGSSTRQTSTAPCAPPSASSTCRRSASSCVEGPDAETVLNRICANDVAVPVGKIVYTQWLNERGGIEADLTVTREAPTAILIVTAAATQVRDFSYLKDHIPAGARAVATDVTSAHAVLSVHGPQLAGVAAIDDHRRPVQRGLPVRHVAHHRPRLRTCAGQPRHLRR